MPALSVKTLRAPSRHCSDARLYGHTTTAMHDMSTPPPPPPRSTKTRCNRDGRLLPLGHLATRCTAVRYPVIFAGTNEIRRVFTYFVAPSDARCLRALYRTKGEDLRYVADLEQEGEKVLLASGGKPGLGNLHVASRRVGTVRGAAVSGPTTGFARWRSL